MADIAVAVAGSILQQVLQLQGARGLDLERASSGDTSDDELPELRLNILLVTEVFVQILATGVGTLAFIWATVVLLGGFSTFLHKVDFWVITGIVFVEAAKVLGLNSSIEAKFFAQVPPAFLELGTERSTQRRIRMPLTGDDSSGWLARVLGIIGNIVANFILFVALLTSVLLLLPLVAASGCIGLSIFRLHTITRDKQYRDSGADDSKANVLRALIFFYALVLAQGGLFLVRMLILGYRTVVKNQVCKEYQFEKKDTKLIDKYIDRTSSACIKTGVLNTINRKLVSFSIDLLHSEYSEDRISGVQVLHTLTSVANKTHERATAHIQSSPDCIARMLVLLSSKSGIDENSKVNLALIVKKISKELRLSDIDGATESISSLIDPYLTKISTQAGSVSNVSQQNGDNKNHPLIIHGLEILAKLAGKNADNCTRIFSTKDLFPKIIAPISNELYRVSTHDGSTIEIAEKSLRVVSKLVNGTHDINRKIRHEIRGEGLVVDRIIPILDLEQRYDNLKVPAIKILSVLDLVNIFGDDQVIVVYIDHLMGLLNSNANINIKKAAAKALVLLATSTTHCATIMNWRRGASRSSGVVQQLSPMLSYHSDPSYRNAVAQLLTQFCVHSTDAEIKAHLKTILHKVLNVIIYVVDGGLGSTDQESNFIVDGGPVQTVLRLLNRLVNVPGAYNNVKTEPASTPIKAGSRKTLVAFLALALQICDKLSDANGFNAAVAQITRPPTHLSNEAYLVDRFGKIIAMFNKDAVRLLKGRGPSDDYLMTMKLATKLCAWVMRTNASYVAYFQQKDIDQKLQGALEAMRGLELGVLLTYSADELTNYETLSSIVEDARRPIIQSRQTTPPPPPPPPSV